MNDAIEVPIFDLSTLDNESQRLLCESLIARGHEVLSHSPRLIWEGSNRPFTSPFVTLRSSTPPPMQSAKATSSTSTLLRFSSCKFCSRNFSVRQTLCPSYLDRPMKHELGRRRSFEIWEAPLSMRR